MPPSRRGLFGLGLGLAALPGFSAFARTSTGMTAHDFSFTAIDGSPLPMKNFRNKVVLVVNTASQCGYTPQYTDLQALWVRYQARGLVVLGVPCNDFGGQEPGTAEDIKKFCEVNFDVDFPLTEKQSVSGAEAHPFYKWAAAELGEVAKPRWNFHKYLIDGEGHLVDWFSTVTKPSAEKVIAAVEAALSRLKAG